jgi:Tfp pilus assembly protein FimV
MGTRDGVNAKTHKAIGLLGGAAALIVALGWGVNAGGYAADVQAAPAAPVHLSPPPPSPPPPPPAPPAMTQSPDQDYWTGQGDTGGAPGGGGG